MRIISGRFKGKKLLLPKDKNTRPLKDLVKESIFNLLEHSKKINVNLKGSTILDLFISTEFLFFTCSFLAGCYIQILKMVDVWVFYKSSISMMGPLFFHQNTELWIWGDRSRLDLPEYIGTHVYRLCQAHALKTCQLNKPI